MWKRWICISWVWCPDHCNTRLPLQWERRHVMILSSWGLMPVTWICVSALTARWRSWWNSRINLSLSWQSRLMNGVWTMPLCAKSFLQRACIWKPVTRIPSAISWLQRVFPIMISNWASDLLRKSASMDVQLFTDCAWTPCSSIRYFLQWSRILPAWSCKVVS